MYLSTFVTINYRGSLGVRARQVVDGGVERGGEDRCQTLRLSSLSLSLHPVSHSADVGISATSFLITRAF